MAAVEMKVLTPEERLQLEDGGLRSYHRNTMVFRSVSAGVSWQLKKPESVKMFQWPAAWAMPARPSGLHSVVPFGVPFAVESMQLLAEYGWQHPN